MLVLRVDGQFTDPTLDVLTRDPLLVGASGGVRFLFDLGFQWSYPGGEPANGQAVRDVSEHGDASVVKAASQTIGFNGNGFDFSTMSQSTATTDEENHILAPDDVWASIDEDQYFLWCGYFKLPSSGDWNSDSTIYPMFCSSAAGYQSAADPLTVVQNTTTGTRYLQFRRQTAVGTVQSMSVDAAAHHGQVVQAACWRNAAGRGALLRSEAGGLTQVTAVVGDLNTADISACRPRFGSVAAFTDYSKAAHRTARNYRMYRAFIEDLAMSERSPSAVLEEDWQRTLDRDVFS